MKTKTEQKVVKLNDSELYDLYLKNVEPKLQDIVVFKYLGYTFTDISNELNISNSELWRMLQHTKNPAYAKLQEAFNIEVNDSMFSNMVENALYQKCVGFYVEEEQAIKCKQEYYNKKNKKCTQEVVEIVKVKKWIPAEFTAQRFYLLNHKSDKYHIEQKTDNAQSLNDLIASVKDITISVKKKANEEV